MCGTMHNKPADFASAAKSYCVPTASSETEFMEKRSHFIGHVWRVDSEEEARTRIMQMKAKYHDARHNCWCYLIREGGIVRYSDDGEPQGTAGQPMLEVFRREGVENVCCVVTRYFGGILLGAGGLIRAYVKSAKDALDAAGISVMLRLATVATPCPYSLLERVKLEIEAADGTLGEVEYAAEVRVHALLPEERAQAFIARIIELTSGGIVPEITGEALKAVPQKEINEYSMNNSKSSRI